jgi:outer membrane autotransporter protein
MDDVSLIDDQGNIIATGTLSDDITTQFVAPFLSLRFNNKAYTGAFLMGLSMGYIGYKNKAELVYPMELNGSTFGLSLEMGYDIKLSDNLFLGFQASFLMGALSKMTMEDTNGSQTIEFEEGEYESMSRLDLSVGLRFSK